MKHNPLPTQGFFQGLWYNSRKRGQKKKCGSNKLSLIGATAQKLLMINMSQNGEVAACGMAGVSLTWVTIHFLLCGDLVNLRN